MIYNMLAVAVMALQFSVVPAIARDTQEIQAPARTPITPRDDAAMDSSFVRFRERLIAAARTGNVQELVAMMPSSPRVNSEPVTPQLVLDGFEVVNGQPWYALVNALELGVAKSGDLFLAPYLAAMPADVEDRAAVVARNVRMRSEPRSDAAILATLSMEWVALDRTHVFDPGLFHHSARPQDKAAWARVVAPDGQTGYVYGLYVWNPLHLRFLFERVDGEWKLTRLVVGD